MSGATAFAARHSSETPEWYTPAPFVEAARQTMGGIDLDPASCLEANQVVRAGLYFTEADNGLTRPWSGRVFLNPPGGLVAEFWIKLLQELTIGRVSQFVWIGYSLEQLQTLQNVSPITPLDYKLCIPKKRIAFVENSARRSARVAKLEAAGKRASKNGSPSHANYIAYGGPDGLGFTWCFAGFGRVRI